MLSTARPAAFNWGDRAALVPGAAPRQDPARMERELLERKAADSPRERLRIGQGGKSALSAMWFLPYDDAGMRYDRAWAHACDLHANGLISDATKERLQHTLSDELEEAGHAGGAPETLPA